MKESKRFPILLVLGGLSGVAFLLALIATIVYASNCASEFNGNTPSPHVIGFGIAAIICAGIAFLVYLVGFFLAKKEKSAWIMMLARIGNYAAFALLLGAFLYQILDEYQLLGTILYPIVSGAVGDPVDPILSSSYFSSLIIILASLILSLVTGIVARKKSHKVFAGESKAESEAKI